MKFKINSSIQDTIVIPVYREKKKVLFFLDNKIKNIENIETKIKLHNFEAQKETTLVIDNDKNKIILLGLDKKFNNEDIRRAYSVILKTLKNRKEKKVIIKVPRIDEETIKAVIEGLDLSDYKFDKYFSKKDKEINLEVNLDIPSKFSKLLKNTLLVDSSVKSVRDLINENSDIITPKYFEKISREFAKKNKLKMKVLDEKAIQKEKLNLLWAVGRGSQHPPRLILIEYNGNPKSKEKMALVGKGITFDTGGINLKPTRYIEDMKMDMGGAATVLEAFKSAVQLKLKKNLVLVISTAENGISSSSYKPGDIFVSHKGISVEVANTDAEGRLVLGDAISYVQKYYKPTHIIDAATLTGACLVALGPSLIAMVGNDEKMKRDMFESGENTFDRVWELPIYDEHRDLIKSKFADIKNLGGNYGGTITAAAFIEKFIDEKVKWVHLDIAGAARSYGEKYYIPEYGTGIGVRLLVDFLKKN